MTGWKDHDGKGCPLPYGTLVWVSHRDGLNNKIRETAGYWAIPENGGDQRNYWVWNNDRPGGDIIAYYPNPPKPNNLP